MRGLIHWRFVVASAILAMALSFLVGGIKGIHLGTLAIRASIGAVFFAVLAIGINLLVVNLFPEFFDAGKSAKNRSEDESLGSRVDITLPSEARITDNSANGDTESTAKRMDKSIAPASEPGLFSDSISDVGEVHYQPGYNETSVLGSERDPEELAQAIHTVITRDGKD